MNKPFWHNKKVLITGHTGFKGSWLTLLLKSLGSDVLGVALPPENDLSLFNAANISELIDSRYCDLRDAHALDSIISSYEPEIIFHLAAQALVRKSYADPLDTYSTNIMGTVNLLESSKKISSIRVILNVTSDKCYENKEWIWGYKESDALGGYDPYSSSKACSEIVSSAYYNSFLKNIDVHLATARAGNVIGGGDWSTDRLIPDIIKSLMNKKPLTIRYPKAIRPWQHVLEPLNGYLDLAENLYVKKSDFSGAWNFGPYLNDTKDVEWIVNKICSIFKYTNQWHIDEKDNPHEANYLKLDISKSEHFLNWKPIWNIEKALNQTINWYEEFYERKNAYQLCMKQIDEYNNDRIN